MTKQYIKIWLGLKKNDWRYVFCYSWDVADCIGQQLMAIKRGM